MSKDINSHYVSLAIYQLGQYFDNNQLIVRTPLINTTGIAHHVSENMSCFSAEHGAVTHEEAMWLARKGP